jgi:hypothetical protein
VSILLAWSVLAGAPRARASQMELGIVPFWASTILAIGSLVSGVQNARFGSRGERPSQGWLAAGYVSGSLSTVAGAVMLGAALYLGVTAPKHVGVGASLLAIPAAVLAVGVFALSTTRWSHSQSQASTLQGMGVGGQNNLGWVGSARVFVLPGIRF